MAQVRNSSGTKLPPLHRGPLVGNKRNTKQGKHSGGGKKGEPEQQQAAGNEGHEPEQKNEGIDFYASYVSEAVKHMQLKQLDTALERLESASKLRPKDPNSKLLKARCFISQSKFKRALKVIDTILGEDPENYHATEMKGEVLYHVGSFEQAIVQYQKARSIRPKKRSLQDGIENCEQALQNAIGPNQRGSQSIARDKSDLEMEEPDNSSDARFFEDKEAGVIRDITERDTGEVYRGGAPKKKQMNHHILLGDFYRDYVFLQGLLDRQIVTNKKTSLGKEVAPVVEEALKYLDTRSDFWQRQEPLYKREKGAYKVVSSKKGSIRYNTDSKLKYRNAMLKINQMYEEGDHQGVHDLALDTIKMVQDAPDEEISPAEKVIFTGELLSFCGLAQQKLGNNKKARDYFTQDKDLAYENDNEDGKYRSLDNLTSNYIANQDYNSALGTLEERLKLTEDKYKDNPSDKGLEADLAWLHHEMARTHLHKKNMEKAMQHAMESEKYAEACDDDAWIIQSKFVAGEVCFETQDFDNAKKYLTEARDMIDAIDDQEGEFVPIREKIESLMLMIKHEEACNKTVRRHQGGTGRAGKRERVDGKKKKGPLSFHLET